MDKLWTFYSSVILLSVIQIRVLATECNVSVTSPSASSLNVSWTSYTGATTFMLDLRIVNPTNVAPITLMKPASQTQLLVHGLRTGTVYNVTLKVYNFYNQLCKSYTLSSTVPATSQITFAKSISSTSIKFEWSSVKGADGYILFVEVSPHNQNNHDPPNQKINQTFTALSGQVDGLTPATTYVCSVESFNSAGRGVKSNKKTIITLVQPPTNVTIVGSGKTTADLTWDSVPEVLLYQVTVTDSDPSKVPVTRNTFSTSMEIINLEPCSTYTVGVSSVNAFSDPGEPSNVIHNTSNINPVTTIIVDYSCSSAMVTVTWDLVFGANLYRATVVDGMGRSLNCTSPGTNCPITMLQCGEKYQVHVTAISDDCESISNIDKSFETVPCAPANLHASHVCSSNVITFSWEHTNNTMSYIATAVDNEGKLSECRTKDNQCPFTNTMCGQYYKFRVKAISYECESEISPPEFIRTAPCLPKNMKSKSDCNSETLITSWDSAAGALSYTVEAIGNNGQFNCTTSTNSCAVTGLPCGDHLSIYILASNDNCSTNLVLGNVAETVPCPPKNVSASVKCSQDSAKFNWTMSTGVIFYIATAQDENGHTQSCNSLGTDCTIEGLKCGQNYTGSVVGTNMKCNSTASNEVNFMTAPCPTTNIEAYRDCDANHALIVWQRDQPTGVYTATIEDQSGAKLNCTSDTINNCKITSLPCGKRYNVTVDYDDGNCQSTSAAIRMDSVPCGPEDLWAGVDCATGELTATWNISVPAENYTTIISGAAGHSLHCNSTETQCTRGGLLCGSSYTVIVFSVTGSCFSLPSTEVTVQTLPCPPTNVSAVHTCLPSPVPVSWVASDSAKHYTAVAVSTGGHTSECSTSNTSCSLPDLQCGEVYTIGVKGADDNCTGHLSHTVSLSTVPCSPVNVSSQLICTNASAHVYWAPSANALSYEVIAESDEQNLTCSSSTPNCTLNNLLCGQEHSIVVIAHDNSCASSKSSPYKQDQVPCGPKNITTNLSCDTNNLRVSWKSSAVPFNYSVKAVPRDTNMSTVTCDTSGTSCNMSLQCGQMYDVSAKASSGSCCGAYSTPQTVQTAPCSPKGLTAEIDCNTNSLLASWSSSLGAASYTAMVLGPNGFTGTCSSPNLTCSVSGLQCASQYNVIVSSQDSQCTSSPSQTIANTGPCDPVNVTSVLLCGSDSATVSWEAAAGAMAYTVLAKDGSSMASCRTNKTYCRLNQLQCGKVYNLTVRAEDTTCNSSGSITSTLMTAPCSPSIHSNSQICGTNSTSVSWMAMADATGYLVSATAANGHMVSCSSTTPNCTLMGLQCSETYSTTVTAKGSHCDSAPGPSTNITTAPCPPAITSQQYTCGSDIVFNWSDPAGRVSFLAEVAGEGYMKSCHTTNTSCAFPNLTCGLDYNVTVWAKGEQCNSMPSVRELFNTVPCAPQNLTSSLVCLNHSALVSWEGSPSAVWFNVTATGQDGHIHHGKTNASSFTLPGIHCGETYAITVTPHSKTCEGHPSNVYSFKAGLCAPHNITVFEACKDSTVSWSPVPGAEMFIATATASNGQTHTCSSNHSNLCNLTDLQCGESYDVTVVTVDRGCHSDPSSSVVLRTALCPPTNLRKQVICENNTLTLMWDQSPVSGATYTVKTEKIGGASSMQYSTSNTSFTWTNLACGQRYAFSVAARDGNCSSSYSSSIEMSTAPCQPANLTARVDCGTNRGNFSWAESSGADFYTVEVTGDHGHVASCSSNVTSCTIKLHCGHSYSATLVASTESCNSTQHADITFDSAPCLPQDVFAELQCNTNVMNVSWTPTPGSDNYTAWAISTDGHRVSCNSTSHWCFIDDLLCGKVYEVAVTSSSIHCDIIAGSDYVVQSAPCKPENISVDQNCSSNAMTVMWSPSSTAQNYTVKATSASGVNSTCDSTGSRCSFLDLSCGQRYVFSVTGHTNVCMSEMSAPIEKITAPCPPTGVSAQLNCTTRHGLVSWSNAGGDAFTAYSVKATSTNGHNSSCSEMGRSCYLINLVCGQEYSVVVEAMHTGCAGPSTAPTMLTTEPCVPVNVSVHYNVSNGWVKWEAAHGATSYSVQAVTDQGSMVTCNTTNTTACFLNGLQCGNIYNVTVTAWNLACRVISDMRRLMTEPCPPTNVQASMACEQLTATVSWQQSELAVGYVAYFDNQNSHKTSCVAMETETSCDVSGLMCGTVYNVWVKALGKKYNSSDSAVHSLTTGPCQSSSIDAIMDCEAHSATVSWQPSVGAASYITKLTAMSGHYTSCATNHTNCEVDSLRCGEKYNVTVKALGNTCNYTAQMPGYLTTEPCVPMNLSVHYNISTAQVTWGPAKGASSYSVQAVTDQGLTSTCNATNTTSCFLNSLQCGQIYNVTVMARNQACNSTVTSDPYCLKTEPCPPTNVQASMACEQLTATVSWQLSNLAVGYVAYFDNQNGHETSCYGSETETTCDVSGLMCGTEYNVWVKALGMKYNSSDSTVYSLTSAPCLPAEVEVHVDCHSDGAAVVSWNSTHGTANFSLTAIVSGSLQTLCHTQQRSCNVTGLSCGETYNLTLTASNTQCSLTAPTHTNLTTRSCPPKSVDVDLQCGSSTAVVSWVERSGDELYVASAIKASGGEVKKCNYTGSQCQIHSLDCGETYNFTVRAYSQGCWSLDSHTVVIQTEPCQPVIVSAQAPCQSEQAQISWQQANGVVNYLVTVTGSLGYQEIHNITTTDLSSALPCGQEFNVTIVGEGSECYSAPSTPAFFKTTPCVPRYLTTYVQCESNIGSVSWGSSEGAETYDAIATGLDGHTHLCVTNTTSCTWDDLHCGERYTVVVIAKDAICSSLPSNSTVIYMDPCMPQNLTTSMNCDAKVVSLTWDAGEGTQLYMVSAESGNHSVSLTTNVTSAYFSDLLCGQNYSLTVKPQSHHCPGDYSAPASIHTWPCPPAGVYATQNCISGIVTVNWVASNGSEYYTANMETDEGYSQMCMSDSDEGCSVPSLTCGHNFSVSVTASNKQCNTTSSEVTILRSAPCVPTNVSLVMDCAYNTAMVSWSGSRGAVRYLATARSSHGNVSCQTSNLNCSLDTLTCGANYSVEVVAIDDNCSSIPSEAQMFYSAPCPAQNVSAEVSCSSNNLSISWDTMRAADYFLVSVNAEGGGVSESCNTTKTGCSVGNVACGKTYTVQVTSIRGDCRSHSQTHSIISAPCRPMGINGTLDCVTNSAWISWDGTPGAESYYVSAVGEGGYTANCTTSSNTTCEVEDLACGMLYNFTVTAKNSQCEGPPSASIELQTAPCSLAGITAVAQCHNSSILVMWDLMEGGEGNTLYTATAEAKDQTYLSCNDTGKSCFLHGARCDQRYTIIVSTTSDHCSNLRSPPYKISTEPCPPSNLVVNGSCGDQGTLVSWSPSPIANAYHVIATSGGGHVHTCNSASANCSLADLQCDQQYTVVVRASHENCSSNASDSATLHTGPCKPDNVSVEFNCSDHSASLSWSQGDNAVDYYGCAKAGNGAMLHCHSRSPQCSIHGLECGTVYNFSVKASDGTCNSSYSDPVQSGAAPCPPDTVEVMPLPVKMDVQVLRFEWTPIACNNTTYLLRLTGSLLGDNQTLFELSSYWTSVTYFEIPLPCGSDYTATVESRSGGGTSEPSVPLKGKTAPCPPLDATYTNLTVSWNASVFATQYSVYQFSVTPENRLCHTTGLFCFLPNITASDLWVTASNMAGESETTNVTIANGQARRRRDLSEQDQEGLVLHVTQVMSTIILQWSPTEDSSFSLLIRKEGSPSEDQERTVYDCNEIFLDEEELSPDSVYCFTVSASHSGTSGPESNSVCVRTSQRSVLSHQI